MFKLVTNYLLKNILQGSEPSNNLPSYNHHEDDQSSRSGDTPRPSSHSNQNLHSLGDNSDNGWCKYAYLLALCLCPYHVTSCIFPLSSSSCNLALIFSAYLAFTSELILSSHSELILLSTLALILPSASELILPLDSQLIFSLIPAVNLVLIPLAYLAHPPILSCSQLIGLP